MRFDVGTSCLILLSACLTASISAPAQTPTLAVNVAANRHAISHDIYGIANYGLDPAYAKEIQVGNIRWGGDGTTRYNWLVDSSNAGFDWFFMGGNGATNPTPGASVDQMISTYQPADVLLTIPIIPYVNKLAAWNCSFPVSVYGPQQSTNPYVHPNGDNCGNSLSSNGTQLLDTQIYANHIDNSPAFQTAWLQHLVGTFGHASSGGVAFYQLDNEPYGWSNTHRDVEPVQPDYPTITQLGEEYAAAIKQVDPSAMVLGPSDFTHAGWLGDTSKQNNLFAGQYYLQQMAAYQKQNGTRILDYFDEHYYPSFSDAASQLAVTRTLWDTTYNSGNWVEQYYFHGPMKLIPRFKDWVNTYYPGTKIALSEYSIDSGQKSIVDALAEMDVLGIFGREQLDFANMWNTPAPSDPIAYAFRMFRNYDGSGAQYGDTWVNASSSDQGQLSVYAAQRSKDNAVTILVLNKTTADISTTLALSGVTLPSTAAAYSYTGANLTKIVSASSASIANNSISYKFPAYSATLFAFTPAASPTTTVLAASNTQPTSGQSITLTATVSGSPSPTGTVSFNDGSTALGTATISNGTATFTNSTLSTGPHVLTATYGGDTNNAASNSTSLTITVAPPPPAATTTTLSASTAQPTSGQNVILTATVSGSASPTGTVTFKDSGASIGTATLTGGNASFSTTTLSPGPHTLTATYSGDPNNAASSSGAVTITVAQPAPASTTTTLTALPTQPTTGQGVSFTAVVSSTATATGTVIFKDNGAAIGTANLNGNTAIFNTSTLTAGPHSLTATYSGDTSNAASSSAPITLTVAQPTPTPPTLLSTTTNLSASATQLTSAQSLTLTATVQTSATGPSAGTVTFHDGANVLGEATLSAGTAVFTTTLAAGDHTLTAAYVGNAIDAPSTSNPLTLAVTNPAPGPQDFTLQLAQSAMSLAPGTSGKIGLSITPQNGFNQQLTLTCVGLPAGATFTFSPLATVSNPPAGSTAGSLTGSLTITLPPATTPVTSAFLSPLAAAFLLGLHRRRSKRVSKRALAAIAGMFSLLLLAGCGSSAPQAVGTSASTGSGPTSYAIQITATAPTGQAHSQPLTLTVQ